MKKRGEHSAFYFSGLVGVNHKFRRMLETLKKMAGVDACILLEGETGTGKELLAHAIHTNSPRKTGRFVVIDCGTSKLAAPGSEKMERPTHRATLPWLKTWRRWKKNCPRPPCEEHKGNKSAAARALGISRKGLSMKMQRYVIMDELLYFCAKL